MFERQNEVNWAEEKTVKDLTRDRTLKVSGPTSPPGERDAESNQKFHKASYRNVDHLTSKSSKSTSKSHTRSAPYNKAYRLVNEKFIKCKTQCTNNAMIPDQKVTLSTTLETKNEERSRTYTKHYSRSSKSTKTKNLDVCCQGGVSFLKFHLSNLGPGLLTMDPENLGPNSTLGSSCHTEKRKISRSRSKSAKSSKYSTSSKVFFVNCNDDCLRVDTACQTIARNVTIDNNISVCLGLINEITHNITFDQKMPHSLPLYFAKNNHSGAALVSSLHTSCSRPIYPPYTQEFTTHCDEGSSQDKRVSDIGLNDNSPRIVFEDGISTGFYNTFMESRANFDYMYSYNFSTCGYCNCGTNPPTNIPSSISVTRFPTSSPSLFPTLDSTPVPEPVGPTPAPEPVGPTGSPTGSTPAPEPVEPTVSPTRSTPTPTPEPVGPTVAPTGSTPASSSPTPQPTSVPSISCHKLCINWIGENCNMANQTGKCEFSNDRKLIDLLNAGTKASSKSQSFEYHKKMIFLYQKLSDRHSKI